MSITQAEKEEICKKLWVECKDELTSMCRYKLSSHIDEVEDVVAEAFYYLCLAVFEEKPIANPKAWLIAVTNNLIKKKYSLPVPILYSYALDFHIRRAG